MCRCADRRIALRGVAASLAHVDLAGTAVEVRTFGASIVADVRDLAGAARGLARNPALAAAHARLKR